MNPMFFPVVVLAALLFYAGNKAGMRATAGRARLLWALAGAILAVPAVLFATYYFHWFDDALWLAFALGACFLGK